MQGEPGIFVSLSDRLQLPHQPLRHLHLNLITPPPHPPAGLWHCEEDHQSTSSQSTPLTTATHAMCWSTSDLRSAFQMQNLVSFSLPTHAHARQTGVFSLPTAPTHRHRHTAHKVQDTSIFCASVALKKKEEKKAQVLFSSPPSLLHTLSPPKLGHEICIHIQYVGIESQHAE